MSLTFEEFEDLDDIRARLADGDAGIRRVAVMDLVEVVDPEAADLAIAALKDTDAAVRADEAEVERNPRSRSAVLRAGEVLA